MLGWREEKKASRGSRSVNEGGFYREQWGFTEWFSISRRWMSTVNGKHLQNAFVLNPFYEIKFSTDWERMVLHGWGGRNWNMRRFHMRSGASVFSHPLELMQHSWSLGRIQSAAFVIAANVCIQQFQYNLCCTFVHFLSQEISSACLL